MERTLFSTTATKVSGPVIFITAFAGLLDKRLGVCVISDVGGLARLMDLDPQEFRSDPLSFEEDGALAVPWPVAERIARRAAEPHPGPVLRHVENEKPSSSTR